MGFHLGLHLHSKLKKLESAASARKSESGKLTVIGGLDSAMVAKQTRFAISAKFVILQIFWILIFVLGIFCIVHSRLYVYLFWMNAWKLSAPNIFVCVGEYLGMTAGMIALSHFAMNFIQARHKS